MLLSRHTKRREFITLVGGAAVAWPMAVRAQPGERTKRIGVLMNLPQIDQDGQSLLSAFRQRLKALGWSEDHNIRIDDRWAAGDADRLRAYAAELVSLKPDAILGYATPAIAALQQATRTIPIVFVSANDPVGFGFIASLARPGGNITGFVSTEPAMGGKWLQTLREIVPSVARVALIYNPQTHTGQNFPSIEAASRSLSVKTIPLPFRDAAEIEREIGNFAREPKGGLLVLPDNSTTLHRDLIVALAARHRLPAIYPYRRFFTSGGLAYYGSDEKDLWQKAGGYVDRILKGEKPEDLPVQAPTKYELAINLKAAKALDLTVPPMLLARADEVLE